MRVVRTDRGFEHLMHPVYPPPEWGQHSTKPDVFFEMLTSSAGTEVPQIPEGVFRMVHASQGDAFRWQSLNVLRPLHAQTRCVPPRFGRHRMNCTSGD